MNKTIGLFGSSFNPPHLGHKAVIKHCLDIKLFNEIWLLPVFSHPYQKKMPPFEQRVQMARLLCDDIDSLHLKICRIEEELPQRPTYSYHVVKELKKRYPKHDFALILGTDSKKDLNNWYNYNVLEKMVGFHFVPRQGYEDSPFPEVSSSQIRRNLSKKIPIDGLTTGKIINYINLSGIYPVDKD